MTTGLPARAVRFSAVSWLVILTIAPLALAHIEPGRVLYGAAALVYGAAGWICHQRPERSFHLEGSQLPVCARCFGAYVGASLGACAPWWKLPADLRYWRRALVATAAIALFTYLIEVGGVQPGNGVRAATAVPCGIVVGALVVAVAQRQVR